MPTIPLVVFSLTLIYVTRRLLAYRDALRTVQNHPGRRLLLSPLIGIFIPKIKYLTAGPNCEMEDKYEPFASFGCDIMANVSVLPVPWTVIVIADAAVIKEITNSRAQFPKPVEHYSMLTFFGRNIVASEGEEWKKYRKISAPAFADRNYELVWDKSIDIVKGLFNGPWKDQKVVSIDNVTDITRSIALFVISAAGFGADIPWEDNAKIPAGHCMSFKESLSTVTHGILWKVACPDWVMGFTKRLRHIRLAYKELRSYMEEMIRERQNEKDNKRHDLFSRLLEENAAADDLASLSDDELIGNIYIFLMAGHETTANTMAFALALLALYPDKQERLYSHIRSVVPEGRQPSYENMASLDYVLAVLYETLRMFPPTPVIGKSVAEDTALKTCNSNGECTSVLVTKDAVINLSVVGLHYNPRYWEDPESFKPERFLKDWPRDAFLPFSAGARACLGRKFFETEAVATLAMFILRYKVTIKEEPQFSGETFAQRRNRILASHRIIVLIPTRVPLAFTRRT